MLTIHLKHNLNLKLSILKTMVYSLWAHGDPDTNTLTIQTLSMILANWGFSVEIPIGKVRSFR